MGMYRPVDARNSPMPAMTKAGSFIAERSKNGRLCLGPDTRTFITTAEKAEVTKAMKAITRVVQPNPMGPISR